MDQNRFWFHLKFFFVNDIFDHLIRYKKSLPIMMTQNLRSTYIGSIVVLTHHFHLETKHVYWKHALDIGNKNQILEIYDGTRVESKVDGPMRLNWTVQRYVSRRSCMKLDGPNFGLQKDLKWPVCNSCPKSQLDCNCN